VLLNRTGGSVAVVMVFHAAVNASGGLLPVDDTTGAAAGLQLAGQAVLTGTVLALATVLVRRYGAALGGPPPVPHGLPRAAHTELTATADVISRSEPMPTDTTASSHVNTSARLDRHPRSAADKVDGMAPTPGWLRRWGRRIGRALAGLLVLALVGAGTQTVLERRATAAHPPPGDLVTLPDGRALHVQIAGEEHDGPTVLLMSGAGAPVAAWGWVLPAIAEHARVVAYDRAGIGWSDKSDTPTDLDAVIGDLRAALDARGIPGPYVLAGHSLGGHHARAFAERHPDEVAGIVLIDPSHVGAAAVMEMDAASMRPMFTAISWLARIGGLRVWRGMEAEFHSLPQPHRDAAIAQFRSAGYWTAFTPEMADLDVVGNQLTDSPGVFGDTPLHVLIATAGATSADQQRQFDQLAELREDLALLSTSGITTTLPDATHVSIVTERRHAAVVADATITIVEGLR
jgi:pimeloyl-ACP methyl ester carboxylesterase